MKRFLVVLVFVFAFALFGVAYAQDNTLDNDSTFNFPSNLKIIEDEAFEGTVAKVIVLPDGFLFIGEDAFKDVTTLHEAYIPASTIHIAETAFDPNALFIIYGIKGSYADDWAHEHQIPFEELDIWKHALPHGGRFDGHDIKTDVLLEILDPFEPEHKPRETQGDDRSYRLQDRPEFYPIDYSFP